MSDSRNIFRILYLLAATAVIVSCDRSDEEVPKKSQAILSANAISIDSEYANVWDESDEIGVFVMESGTGNILEGHANLRHIADLSADAVSLQPAADTIFFPSDGSSVDFIAYHPFREMDSGYLYGVDLSDQSAPSPRMLVRAEAKGHNSVMNSVRFSLRPEYAKLKVNLKIDIPESKADEGISISLHDMVFKGTFDIIAGNFLPYDSAGDALMSRRTGSVNAFEAYLLPHKVTDKATLTVNNTAEEGRTLRLDEYITSFEKGNQYDLNITVSPEGLKAMLVGVKAYYISDWKYDSEDIAGEIEK